MTRAARRWHRSWRRRLLVARGRVYTRWAHKWLMLDKRLTAPRGGD